MLDLIARRMVYTVYVVGTPHFIITGLYPPPAIDTAKSTSIPISQQQSSASQMFWIIVFYASLVMVVVIIIILVLQLR